VSRCGGRRRLARAAGSLGRGLALLALAALTAPSALRGRGDEAPGVVQLPLLYAGLVNAAEWMGTPSLAGVQAAIIGVPALGFAGRTAGLAAPSPEPGSVRMAWPVGYAKPPLRARRCALRLHPPLVVGCSSVRGGAGVDALA
jgi:hypothetical protein